MPAEIQQPLSVVFTLPGDVISCRRLHDLPNQSLAAGLARGLAAATHPHGPIRTKSVAMQYVQTMRRLVRELHAGGFTGGIADLSMAVVVRYWLTCDHHRERRIRVVLRAYQEAHGGLDPGICRHLAGRRINKIPTGQPNRPYSDNEWRRLTAACTEMISTSHRAHQQALEAAGRGLDPVVHGATRDNLAWILHRSGPVATNTVVDLLGDAKTSVDRAEILRLHRALFPAADTALAYLTLFAMRTGIVPDGIDALAVGDITRTSPNTALLSYKKGRTGGEAVNLPRDAVRLLERWLSHSDLLRTHAGGLAERLWVHTGGDHRGHGNSRVFAEPRTQYRRRAWVRATGVLDDRGEALFVHGGRVRATYHRRRDRSAWTGRTTIDPNHSARVEGDHYLSSHTPAQLDAIEGVIEQAQGDLRRKAAPPVVVTSQDAVAFTAAFPRLVQDAGLDAATVMALLSGEQDVFVAACANPLNSPHAPPGTLCPARPWVCLLCPLAAFTPRHLPNLLRLKEYFSGQATAMAAAQFMRIFGPYAARLDDDVLPRFGPAAINAATRAAASNATALPLNLEELPL
jgi:hypothetical protein